MMRKHSLNMLLHMFPPWVVWYISLPNGQSLPYPVDSWKVLQKEWPIYRLVQGESQIHSVGTISRTAKALKPVI